MQTQTYAKGSHIHGRFNPGRFSRFDKIGKDNSARFMQDFGWTVETNDINEETSGVIFNNTDQRASKTINGEVKNVLIESAVKRADLFRYITFSDFEDLLFDGGVDVETRKLKYVRPGTSAFVAMSDYVDENNKIVSTGDMMLMIPMDCLIVADEDCKEEYKGMGRIPSSKDFKMPVHGCHRVRKYCRKGFGQSGEAEDFYRIPYEYISRFIREGNKYKQIKNSTMIIERGNYNGNRPLAK